MRPQAEKLFFLYDVICVRDKLLFVINKLTSQILPLSLIHI